MVGRCRLVTAPLGISPGTSETAPVRSPTTVGASRVLVVPPQVPAVGFPGAARRLGDAHPQRLGGTVVGDELGRAGDGDPQGQRLGVERAAVGQADVTVHDVTGGQVVVYAFRHLLDTPR